MAAAVLLAACAAQPLPELQPPLPEQWSWATSDAAADKTAPLDWHQWWQAFDDAQLQALIDRALAGNLELAAAAQRVLAARALSAGQEARFRPELHAGTTDAVAPESTRTYLLAGFDARWEWPLFGAAEGAQRISSGRLQAALADWRGSRVSLVAELVRDWLQLRAAQQELALLQAIDEQAGQELHYLKRMVDLQLAPSQSLQQAQANRLQHKKRLQQPQQTIRHKAQQLAILLGQARPDADWFVAGSAAPHLDRLPTTFLPADLLRTRPEIAAAEARVLQAAGELDIRHAQTLPSIGLGASLQWVLQTTDARFNSRGSMFSLGPIIDIPLFDWGQRQARKTASAHELQAALLDYRQSVLLAVAEAQTAWGNYQAAQQQQADAAEAASLAQQHMDAMRKKRDLQLASDKDLTQAHMARLQAELAHLQAQTAQNLAYVAIYKAFGGASVATPDDGAKAEPEESGDASDPDNANPLGPSGQVQR